MPRPPTAHAATSPLPPEPPLRRADGTPVRVLVVDDERDLTDVLVSVLRGAGYEAWSAASGAQAVHLAAERRPDAVILDVMLPDLDGWQVLQELRRSDPGVCVLFLTARDAVEDRVAGIRAGGDDYLTKPFHLEEVVVRLRSLLRRAGAGQLPERSELVLADLRLDEDGHEVHRAGERIELTATEFAVLRLLLRNPRRVLSKATILQEVWGSGFGGQAHVVELYISYLRRKVHAGRTPMIHTVRGVGYVLREPG